MADGGAGVSEEENPFGFEGAELEALLELRSRTKDVEAAPHWRTLHALKRYYDARSGDLEGAEAQYRRAMAFRRRCGADEILSSGYAEPEAMKYFPTGFAGRDREGFAVLIERIGTVDLVGLHAAVGEEGFFRWLIWYHERQELEMQRATEAAGMLRDKMTVVVDLGGLSLGMVSGAMLDVVRKRTRMEEDNYPEVVNKVFLVNAPALFAGVYSLVSGFMDEGTRSKVSVLGADWHSTVFQTIEPACIPKAMGGEWVEDGDETCASKVRVGGKVPLHFYGSQTGHSSSFTIPAGSIASFSLTLQPGQWAQWGWHTAAANDVNFAVFAQEKKKKGGKEVEGGKEGGKEGGEDYDEDDEDDEDEKEGVLRLRRLGGEDSCDGGDMKTDAAAPGEKHIPPPPHIPTVYPPPLTLLSIPAPKMIRRMPVDGVDGMEEVVEPKRRVAHHGSAPVLEEERGGGGGEGEEEEEGVHFSPIKGRAASVPWEVNPVQTPTTLTFVFDNSFSWLTSKQVCVEIDLHEQKTG